MIIILLDMVTMRLSTEFLTEFLSCLCGLLHGGVVFEIYSILTSATNPTPVLFQMQSMFCYLMIE